MPGLVNRRPLDRELSLEGPGFHGLSKRKSSQELLQRGTAETLDKVAYTILNPNGLPPWEGNGTGDYGAYSGRSPKRQHGSR